MNNYKFYERCCNASSSSASTPPNNQLAELTKKINTRTVPAPLCLHGGVGINNEKLVQGN
jgi:hypothetical protein